MVSDYVALASWPLWNSLKPNVFQMLHVHWALLLTVYGLDVLGDFLNTVGSLVTARPINHGYEACKGPSKAFVSSSSIE